MIFLQKILASWWKRILIFIFLVLLGYYLYVFALNSFFKILKISDFLFLFTTGMFFILIPLSISSIIEYLRAGRKFTCFGIHPTKETLIELLISFSLVFIPFLVLFGFLKLLNFNIIINFDNKGFSEYFSILFIIFVTASTEELLFRGIAFQAILDRFGITITLILSSLAFSAAHFFNPHFNIMALINTFLAGVLLGTMFIQTKSLYLPIFWHFFWNATLQVFLGSKVSGQSIGISLIKIDLNSLPHWLFGGNYGIEGGLVCTLILLGTIPLVFKLTKPSPYVSAMIFKRNILESQII